LRSKPRSPEKAQGLVSLGFLNAYNEQLV